ncbi:exosortase V [Polymorphobacter fuscus]|uniref:Exosortase V n=2 Tax=Sandarakinorhabdus fusca TaxID=1439888 RepID=A0A7C9GWE5_9SPHN|nr:exosortase [Polymorphobacter fuscus]MQT16514.1 exosortase V [Polymorphobacter fuscus]
MTLPTLVSLARGPWSMESGVHGPIVVATGGWLIARRLPDIRAYRRDGSFALALAGVLVAIPLYAFGRAYDFISIETAALLLALVSVAYYYLGAVVIRMLWFPIFYLGFVIPIPGWVLDTVTQPLKLLVSEVVTNGLAAFGYPVARVGVTIYVASYQLLVEDACAGLNSLVSLSAIGLFYVYMLRGSNWRYSMLLLALVVPIAIAANMIRVAALVLITYHFGNAAAQGYLHNFAGMVTFTSALLFIFLVDKLLTPVRNALAPDRPEGA